MNVWTRLVKAGLRRPIGSGINASPAVDYYNGGQFRAPHNSVVQVFVELGIIGLFLYLRLHWMTLRTLQRVVTQARENYVEVVNRRREVLARGLQVGLVANFAAAFFLSMAYSNLLWLIFALVAALAASDPTLQPREDTKKTGRR
jgi:O-antigen ligase